MSDQAIEDERRKLARMSPITYPLYAALLRQIDAARKERDEALALAAELQTKLDAAIAEGCEHAADLSACRLANKLLAETFIRETEQYASRQRVHESYLKVMDSVWDGHQKQFDEMLAALRNWLDAEKGCDNSTCNIGGGLCADCSVLAEDCKGEAAGIVAKYKKGGE
jgi:hypothetical protein